MPNPFRLPTPAQRLLDRAPKGLVAFLSVGVSGLAIHMGLVGLLSHLFTGMGLGVSTLAVRLLSSSAPAMVQVNLAQSLAWWIALCSEIWRYILVTLVSQGISFGVFTLVGAYMSGLPASLAVLPGAVVATLFSYTGQRFFTFAAPNVEAAVVPEVPVI